MAFQKNSAHYTCELADFSSAESPPSNPPNPPPGWNARIDALRNLGYSIILQGCDADHFTALAAPPAPDGTQGRAFCTSESGVLRIANDGSTEHCLSSGRDWHSQ
jgi:hypothetical protein